MKNWIQILFASTAFLAIALTSVYASDKGPVSLPVNEAKAKEIINNMIQKFGQKNDFRITRGVTVCASLWTEAQGSANDFESFCMENFISDQKELDATFNSISNHMETLFGHFNKIALDLKKPVHLELGEVTKFDEMISGYDVSAHFNSDFFDSKFAYYIALNFPAYNLQEKTMLGKNWSRKEWAYARLGDMFSVRIPANVLQDAAEVGAKAENYIANYNIYMGCLVDEKGKTYFPKDMKLLSHWNLRDELKSHYGQSQDGLKKQRMIYDVMKRIVTQDIPEQMVNKNEYQWNPTTNKLFKDGKEVDFVKEPNTRYQRLLDNFKAKKAMDVYNPMCPTFIQAKFSGEMEIPQEKVEAMFKEFVTSPVIKQAAAYIKKKLGRDLEPFDIWYDGFKARSGGNQAEFDKITKAKYPNPAAFGADIKNILLKLGWTPEKAEFVASKIDVDPARGSGHAWGADMKTEKAHLRTRVGKEGMDYKGYNIAVHELGHNVEQTISLYNVDYYMLRSVPNTAFTEAWAFTFQDKDMKLLGMENPDPNKEHMAALDNLWSCYEIMGVSLVDMNVWKWMYANPNCTKEQLKEAVNNIAKEVWNAYYAPVLGQKDQPLLGIYSHMIENPLYLSAYPIGHLIEFQIKQYVEGKNLAVEMERMCVQGRLIPEAWMVGAVGEGISIQPTLKAAEKALQILK